MSKRELLQLAYPYNPKKHGIGGWFMSVKLDGIRWFWDGGVTRGMLKADVPWANTEKDKRYKKTQMATGLWTRYGHPVYAPDWFLDHLPACPLDGEGYKPGPRQELMSIVKKQEPGVGWKDVKFHIFDTVPIGIFLREGRINNPNFKKVIGQDALAWYFTRMKDVRLISSDTGFLTRYNIYKTFENDVISPIMQSELPFQTADAEKLATVAVERIVADGGEGAILRARYAPYEVVRTNSMVKMKPREDAEGTVIGYITGRATDKGSKLLGKLGSLILQLDSQFGHRILNISGFTDDERQLSDPEWAAENPESECPPGVVATHFPLGTSVTFRYRGVTKDKIPVEAAYWRKRHG